MFFYKLLPKTISILITASILASCSQNSLALKDSLLLSLQGIPDVSMTPEEIQKSPYARISTKRNKTQTAFMVLGYAESKSSPNGTNTLQLKWVSSIHEMLITEHGRIVKTLDLFDGNLQRSYSKEPDPLVLGLLNDSTPKKWQRYIDWQPGNYSQIMAKSTFTLAEKQQIDINGKLVLSQHVIEDITVPQLDLRYKNQFWLDLSTQKVLASIQRPAPLLTEIEIKVLKPFVGS